MIRFLHNEREVEVGALPADTTILEYLREHCNRPGTKEGCASGDCGACTVVTVSAEEDGLRYRPINACIAPLGSLQGKQLITVEALADGEALHPVQQALVDCHGSQCGFCTPGFVMSLFALFHTRRNASREEILEALGGNLCRCTGYRPIIAAAEQALAEHGDDRFETGAAATLDRLRALSETDADTAALRDEGSQYLRPASAAGLATLLDQHEDARLVAGGTDLLLEVTQGLKTLPTLIDICAVPELHHLEVTPEQIRIGAALTHSDARTTILGEYPELAELIERFGSLQIRSQGTIAGNLANASPIGDWPPVFLALGVTLSLESLRGLREVSLEEFFRGYRETALARDEFIRSMNLPRRAPGLFLRAYKISKRYEDDISSVCGVFALHLEHDRIAKARVAFGGMAAVPARARACEEALTGLDLRADALAEAAAALDGDFTPISDARASGTYRALVARRLLDRLQGEFRGQATRVHDPHHEAPAPGSGAGLDG